MKTVEIIVTGKVQGVFYRQSASEKAQQLGLTGFAENLANGNVRIVITGEEDAIETLYQWCRLGPPKARVESIHKVTIPDRQFDRFEIRRKY
jgi:acylphosphatase